MWLYILDPESDPLFVSLERIHQFVMSQIEQILWILSNSLVKKKDVLRREYAGSSWDKSNIRLTQF